MHADAHRSGRHQHPPGRGNERELNIFFDGDRLAEIAQ
jgi:hypothetical protein